MALIPKTIANWQTSLASGISSSAASLVAASITTDDGVVVPSGTYGITVDQGTNVQEHMIGTFDGSTTTFTITTRGVSVIDGSTNIPARQFAHRRGASIKMTDHPALIQIDRKLDGQTSFASPDWTGVNSISGLALPISSELTKAASVEYVNNSTTAGAANASTVSKGIVQLATDAQLAAGTDTGSTGALLAAHGLNFSDTGGTANKVPVSNASGKIAASYGGAASSIATLDGSSKVVENPANATATPTASKIAISDASATLNQWVTQNQTNLFTTGEAINGTASVPIPVCIKAFDGLVYKADANDTTLVNAFGFINTNASISTNPYIITGGVLGGFSGLTVGATYFVSDTVGTISVTPSTTTSISVGVAVSATQILVKFGKKKSFGTITHSTAAGATDNQPVTIGFIPSLVTYYFTISFNGSSPTLVATGIAVWNGTTGVALNMLAGINDVTNITKTTIGAQPISAFVSGKIRTTGGSSTANEDLYISSLSSTGWVSSQISAHGSGTLSAVIKFIAEE